MSDLKPVKDLDPNAWYHLTEARVDDYDKKKFGGMLQIDGKGVFYVFGADKGQYFQFQPVDNKPGRYAIRASKTAINRQLGVCRVEAETDSDKTRPCMLAPDGSDVQKWDVASWGGGGGDGNNNNNNKNSNSTYRLVNVANGTGYHLDVHPGSAVFLSSNIDTAVYQPAQHWLMTSAKPVNDGAYSTVFSDVPASTTTSSHPGSSSSSSSGGLSSGAAAGIGVGVALAVIAAALLAFFLWRHRRRRQRLASSSSSAAAELGDNKHGITTNTNTTAGNGSGSYRDHPDGSSPEKTTPVPPYSHAQSPPPPQELPHHPAPVEAPADERFELDSTQQQSDRR
ncbi:hypothetical protein JDV02_000652 [Purpureocillium takamizusanense]|uniref:Ricin B lectin domain-containing protein n=1 Tax=Purpureocillium takamizusanense TaxID=2060973 RepID=A0A9Q8Q7M6_9HYPO|nr:uncharacterized protein JDV02_000652 [Purpureocillium takamizusanense]UNI13966.1 hypothetical protein JDV02_000652 [Purpureocillium takamizusanense]